jgi:hypothetical protein
MRARGGGCTSGSTASSIQQTNHSNVEQFIVTAWKTYLYGFSFGNISCIPDTNQYVGFVGIITTF